MTFNKCMENTQGVYTKLMSYISSRSCATDYQNQALLTRVNSSIIYCTRHAHTSKSCVLKQHTTVGSLSKAANSNFNKSRKSIFYARRPICYINQWLSFTGSIRRMSIKCIVVIDVQASEDKIPTVSTAASREQQERQTYVIINQAVFLYLQYAENNRAPTGNKS